MWVFIGSALDSRVLDRYSENFIESFLKQKVLTTFDVLVVQRHARDFVIEKSLSMAATTTAAIESVGMCRPQSGGHLKKNYSKRIFGAAFNPSFVFVFVFSFYFLFVCS